MLLTSRIVRAARPREHRYVLADEHGMNLHVMPRGSKWGRFRYRFRQTERMISLGVYPHVDLATARRLHADARGLLARNIDPSADRKENVRRTHTRSKPSHASGLSSWSRASQKVCWLPTRSKMRLASSSATSFPPWALARSPTSARTSSSGCSKRLSSAPTSRSRLSGS